jgi:hypothetical protein
MILTVVFTYGYYRAVLENRGDGTATQKIWTLTMAAAASSQEEWTDFMRQNYIGCVRISLDHLSIHPCQRQTSPYQIQQIKSSLSFDILSRDKFPIDVSLDVDLSDEDTARLRRLQPYDFWKPPAKVKALVIDGGHRVAAAKQWLKETVAEDGKRPDQMITKDNRPGLNSWLCTVYKKSK